MSNTKIDLYPCRDEVFYGRGVWPIGEDGDMGLSAEGHDRRALAAINAYQRHNDGIGWRRHTTIEPPTRRWAVVVEECGCTEAEHELHVADDEDDDGCVEHCEFYGLPPCQDLYAWTSVGATDPGAPGALAFTEVRW